MIKSLAYFPSQLAQNSTPVIQAVLESLRYHGIQAQENSWHADAAIIWSVLWSGRMSANQEVWIKYREANKPVVIIDVGALHRGQTWKMAVNSITANGYYGHQENLDWNRPQKLGVKLATNTSLNPKIIIAAQHARSLQVAGLVSMEDWINQQIQQLRKVTDRPIVLRPHPRSALRSNCFKDVVIEKPQRIANTYDSYNLDFDCHALINYNSGPGTQAALSGTRPIVDQTSLARPVSINIANIEQPYTVDRDQWLVEICHTEYTVEEIAQGLWIHRLKL